jgi:hypothetical protein
VTGGERATGAERQHGTEDWGKRSQGLIGGTGWIAIEIELKLKDRSEL